MKKIIFKGLATALLATGLVSCSEDYLSLKPVTNVDQSTVSATVEGARLAINGIAKSMYTQYQDINQLPNMNGEPWYSIMYGDMLGQDAFYLVWGARVPSFYDWSNNVMANGAVPGYAWSYPYNLIRQANTILLGEETAATDVPAERDFVMAQARTFRAHAYIRLIQMFAPRWADSNNGETLCVVLRTEPNTADVPLSSMKDVMDFIYNDLKTAIAKFESASDQKRTFIWEPDINVAKGLLARAAMIREDWDLAKQMAKEARASHPIMTADQYKGGFAEANDEWMWANTLDEQIYYWAFGAWFGCNGPYPALWGSYGAGAINYSLARQIPDTDVRSFLYFTPEWVEKNWNNNPDCLRPVSARIFYRKTAVNPADMNCMNGHGGMQDAVSAACRMTVPNGNVTKWGIPYTNRFGQSSENAIVIPFGAQFKFWGTDTYGKGQFPYMRGAEMLLIEAEAAYMSGDETTAKACINELLAKRNPGQTVTSTGDALLQEIRLQRRIELWGEGYNFHDLKRWGLPLVRETWEEGNTDSNNIPEAYKLRKETNDPGWRLCIPRSEYMYNHAVDRSTAE